MPLVLGAPGPDTVLQVGPHQSGVEGNHLPQPSSYTSFDAAQDTIGFPSYKHTLLAHILRFIHLGLFPSPPLSIVVLSTALNKLTESFYYF